MKKLTDDQAEGWLEQREYSSEHRPEDWKLGFGFPEGAERRVGLAMVLTYFYGGTEVLFRATRIWGDPAGTFVFDRFLLSGGLETGLFRSVVEEDHIEDLAVLFGPEERLYVGGAFQLALLYDYGGFLARADGSLMLTWKGGDFIFPYAKKESVWEELVGHLLRLGLAPLTSEADRQQEGGS